MAHIDDLMDATSTKFHLAMLAAKRAREINNYYQQLGEGSGRFVAPLVSIEANKPLTIALEEIAEGKIVEAEPVEVVEDDPLAFIGDEEVALEDLEEVAPALSAVPDPEADEDPTAADD
jgi:DNA-directed RNA polymerase subunit omega